MRHRAVVVGAVVLVLGLLGAACSSGSAAPSSSRTSAPESSAAPQASPSPELQGLNTGPAPWPPEMEYLEQRLEAMGLPPLGPEATQVHFHVNLVVYVHGQQVPVPFAIGIDLKRLLVAEIHTHADVGTIHVEASEPRAFTLGMVFDVWGLRFTPECLGGYCASGADRIRVFVDGRPFQGDPTNLALTDGQVIVVVYGTASEVPDPMPVHYVYEGPPQP